MSPSYISPLLPFAPLLTIIPHSIQHARSFLHYPPTRSVIFTVFQCFVLYLGRIADESPSPILFLPLFVLATFLCFCISFARDPLLRERERRSKARHSWTWVAPPAAAANTRAHFSKPLRRRGDQKRVIRGPGSPLLLLSSVVQTNTIINLFNASYEGDPKKFSYMQNIIMHSI